MVRSLPIEIRIRRRMVYSVRPLPLVKGCRWMAYHLTLHTVMHRETETLEGQRQTDRGRQTYRDGGGGGGGGGGGKSSSSKLVFYVQSSSAVISQRERDVSMKTEKDQ